MEPSFANLQLSQDGTAMLFTWKHVKLPFLNSIRRILRAEVPNLAFDEVRVLQNTSLLPDALLIQQITFLPLVFQKAPDDVLIPKEECDCLDKSCPKCEILFELKLHNKTLDRIAVSSGSFSTDSKTKNVITRPDIHFFDLNPTDEIHVKAKVRNNVLINKKAQFAVVSRATWPSDLSLTQRERNDPYRWMTTTFSVVSLGQQSPQRLMIKALELFQAKLERLLSFLEHRFD